MQSSKEFDVDGSRKGREKISKKEGGIIRMKKKCQCAKNITEQKMKALRINLLYGLKYQQVEQWHVFQNSCS